MRSPFTNLSRFGGTLFLSASMLLVGTVLQAANEGKEVGMKLLVAQLPTGVTIQQADCEVLAKAVTKATLAHRNDAPAILQAALSNGNTEETLRKEDRRSCECVGRIVRASIKAAPSQASGITDMAMALYPDCATSLASILDGRATEQPVAGISTLGGAEPSGGGTGAGFPGSPTFGGSSPSGGFALPTPAATPVTSVSNQ